MAAGCSTRVMEGPSERAAGGQQAQRPWGECVTEGQLGSRVSDVRAAERAGGRRWDSWAHAPKPGRMGFTVRLPGSCGSVSVRAGMEGARTGPVTL